MIDKVRAGAAAALDTVHSGASIVIGGFGRTGVPVDLIDELCARDVRELHIIANNGGQGLPGERGIGRLLAENRVTKFSCSFPVNPAFFRRYFDGEVEIELVPQGTLAERLRAGGSGLGGFYTPTAAGSVLADGGFVMRHGTPEKTLPSKEQRVIDGRTYVLETPLRPDFALVKADKADRYGNLRFRLGARNFNPLAAMAAQTTIVQADHVRHTGSLPPDDIHLPGPFVDHVVRTEPEAAHPDHSARTAARREGRAV